MYKEKRITAVIQARMGSTRLPNKSMLWLHGYPIIGLINHRLKLSAYIDHIVFAIPDAEDNDPLYQYLSRIGCTIYRGHEYDVLTRFYCASKLAEADYVLRICADNPFICPTEVDHLISHFYASPSDYSYNHIPLNNSYPDGLGCEIVTQSTLELVNSNASTPHLREHIFTYITHNPDFFAISTTEPSTVALRCPHLKFDVDTSLDYSYLLGLPVSGPFCTGREIVAAAQRVLQTQTLRK